MQRGNFNRCHITRLTLGSDEELSKTDIGEGEESKNLIQSQGRRWQQRKVKQREQKEPNKANDGSRIIGRRKGTSQEIWRQRACGENIEHSNSNWWISTGAAQI